jgi:hypothetical protein
VKDAMMKGGKVRPTFSRGAVTHATYRLKEFDFALPAKPELTIKNCNVTIINNHFYKGLHSKK